MKRIRISAATAGLVLRLGIAASARQRRRNIRLAPAAAARMYRFPFSNSR